jgi:HNH endonuclease
MTWLTLGHTALPLLAGLLCGRYFRHRRLEEVEQEARDDGYCEALRTVLRLNAAELDQLSRDLDATVEQTAPSMARMELMANNVAERFWAKVDRRGPDDCWPWLACRNPRGYGWFGLAHRKNVKAHRYAYELLVRQIPPGLTLDHLCRNPSCVNPAHLEPVTVKENVLRGDGRTAINARKTHCPAGHAYDVANTYVDRHGSRECRACHRRKEAERVTRLKTEEVAS